jgi:hypothetical protein
MKKALFILSLALLSGVVAFCLMRQHRMSAHHGGPLLDSMPELAWVRTDLHLTDGQFAKVSDLHVAYRPKCVELCRCMEESRTKLEALSRKERGVTPELETAIDENARVRSRCQAAMLKHIYDTAAVLDRNQADRYLTTMIPYALGDARVEAGGGHSH